MKTIRDPKQFQQEMAKLRSLGKKLGFVPTMGALHEGHLSLIRQAKKENDISVVSIFVNPLQFGPKEDLKKYPRPIQNDRKLLESVEADYLFSPAPDKMYSKNYDTVVDIGSLSQNNCLTNSLCGKSRPGHFRGVATVVTKLFHLASPHQTYFGAKDFQQVACIRRLIEDLNFDIKLRVMPTVREKDGLAMSSRNIYLSADERVRARSISRTLFQIRDQILAGNKNILSVRNEAVRKLRLEVDHIDYLEIVDALSLEPVRTFQKKMVVLAACFVGKTRLIDNVTIN